MWKQVTWDEYFELQRKCSFVEAFEEKDEIGRMLVVMMQSGTDDLRIKHITRPDFSVNCYKWESEDV